MLGMQRDDIGERLCGSCGNEQLIVPLATEAAVRHATLRPEAVTHLKK